MDKTIRRYTNFTDMKADESRSRQSRPLHERVDPVSELTQEHYAMNGTVPDHSDFKELLSTLNEHGVKYLVVGAYAVSVHAQPCFTRDLNFLVKAEPANAQAVHQALATFGAPLEGIRAQDFADKASFPLRRRTARLRYCLRHPRRDLSTSRPTSKPTPSRRRPIAVASQRASTATNPTKASS